jgi:hypothetical protein
MRKLTLFPLVGFHDRSLGFCDTPILVCERNLPFKVSNQLTRTLVKRHNSIRFKRHSRRGNFTMPTGIADRIAPVGVEFCKVLIASPDRFRLIGAEARPNAVAKQACVGMAAAGRF